MVTTPTNGTRLAYDNLLFGETVVASAGDGQLAVNWLEYDFWAPTVAAASFETIVLSKAANADYFAFRGELNGCTLELWENGILIATIDTAERVAVVPFTFMAGADWEIRAVNATGGALTPQIRVVSVGVAMQISDQEIGFLAPALAHVAEIDTNLNTGGQFIGRSLRERAHKFKIVNRPMSESQAYDEWGPFVEHALALPFFFYQDLGSRQDHAFCWLDGMAPQPPRYITPSELSAEINVRGVAA